MTIMQMFPNNSAVQAIREGGYGSADFDIATTPLTYATEERCDIPSSKSVIYRTDTGEELGIHGHGYKPIAPKHMINVGDALLERSDLCLNKLERIIRTSHNGARTFVQYRLPEHTYKTSDGDEASLSLLAISSFDGTWPFMISAAAIQSACTNLQVFVGGEVSVFKAKHTQSLDIEQGGRIITKSLDLFQNQRGLWQQWNDTECSNLQAFKSFAEAIKCKSALDLLYKGYTSPVDALMDIPRRNNSLDYLWYKYSSVYSKRLGNNYWAVYNALTDWSTHFEAPRTKSTANIASVQNDRQQIVREAVKHNHNMKAA